jgi:hypothetical protein
MSLLDIYANFFGSKVAIAPEYIVITLLITFVIYKMRHIQSGFWAWAVPKDLYIHASSILDMKLFFIGRVMALFGFMTCCVDHSCDLGMNVNNKSQIDFVMPLSSE